MPTYDSKAKNAEYMRKRRAAIRAGTWAPNAQWAGVAEMRRANAARMRELRESKRQADQSALRRLTKGDFDPAGRACRLCIEFKPWDAFGRKANGVNGRATQCKACQATARHARYHADPAAARAKSRAHYHTRPDSARRRLYGLAEGEFDHMRAAQGHACKVCGVHESMAQRATLYVDHDHATGRVRGLLCHRCNLGLAFMEDAGFVESATRYLEG